MKQLGQRTARIVLKQSLRPLTTLNKEDGPFLTHIPLPRDTGKVANAKILQTKGAVKQIDPFAAPQRTIAFETNDPSSIEATVEHSYELTAVYTDLFQLLDEQTMIRELTESEKTHLHQRSMNSLPIFNLRLFYSNYCRKFCRKQKSLGTCVCDLSFCDHQSDLFIYARILCDSEYQ